MFSQWLRLGEPVGYRSSQGRTHVVSDPSGLSQARDGRRVGRGLQENCEAGWEQPGGVVHEVEKERGGRRATGECEAGVMRKVPELVQSAAGRNRSKIESWWCSCWNGHILRPITRRVTCRLGAGGGTEADKGWERSGWIGLDQWFHPKVDPMDLHHSKRHQRPVPSL